MMNEPTATRRLPIPMAAGTHAGAVVAARTVAAPAAAAEGGNTSTSSGDTAANRFFCDISGEFSTVDFAVGKLDGRGYRFNSAGDDRACRTGGCRNTAEGTVP